MGEVWLALDEELGGRPVAIKTMHARMLADAEDVARFQREMRLASRMQHPNIMTVFTTGTESGVPFMVMEYLEGSDLGRRPLGREHSLVARIGRETCAALAYAHGLSPGVVHRDIKPGNLFLCDSGLVKVTDFGIAKAIPGTRLSVTGTLVGTFPYMAPEQWLGDPAAFANDIWAVGCVLYEVLAGRLPRAYATPAEYVAAAARREPVTPLQDLVEVPSWLAGAVMAMLQHDPRCRPTAAECVQLLSTPSGPSVPAGATQIPRPQSLRHAPAGWDAGPRESPTNSFAADSMRTLTPRPHESWPTSTAEPSQPSSWPASAGPTGSPHYRNNRLSRKLPPAGWIALSLAVVLAGVLATLGFKDLDRPSATGGPTIGVTSSKASTVTDIDGVTVHPPAFEIVCDPAIDDLGSSESCTTEIQPLSAGENAYITLRLDGITLSDMQRLCRDGYGFWVSDNQAGRAQAQDQLQSPSGAPLSSAASSSYVPPGAVLGSLGDLCPNLLRSSPMNVSNGNVPYIPLNINHYFIAPGPWVIDYRLYSATGELLLSASYKTTVI